MFQKKTTSCQIDSQFDYLKGNDVEMTAIQAIMFTTNPV